MDNNLYVDTILKDRYIKERLRIGNSLATLDFKHFISKENRTLISTFLRIHKDK